jgi:hypothetical protein
MTMDISINRTSLLKSFGLSALIASCGVGLVWLQQTRLAELQNTESLTPESVALQEKAEQTSIELWKKLPAYGYDNLLADWAFLRFLQYFGDDTARELSNYSLSPNYFDVIVDRDPLFMEAYYYLSGSTSIYAGRPDRTVALMGKGLTSMSPTNPPYSYYLWRLKALDEQLFLGDIKASIQSYLKAAEWASYYTDEMSLGVVANSRATAAFLVRNPASKLAQFNAWSLVLTTARDNETRQRAIAEIEKIGGKVTFNGTAASVTLPKEVIEAEKKALGIQ